MKFSIVMFGLLLNIISVLTDSSLQETEKKIMKDLSWNIKLKLFNKTKENTNSRKNHERPVGIQSLQLAKRRSKDHHFNEDQMKTKLFKLMYETIRDCNSKAQKADLLKTKYKDSTAFQIGYVSADVTHMHQALFKTYLTLTTHYDDWQAMEYMNAYEELTHYSVELNQLIDIIKAFQTKLKMESRETLLA